MSIFDRIKRIFSEPKNENEQPLTGRTVSVDELSQEMKTFLIKHEKDEERLSGEISKRINNFQKEATNLISVIEKIDLANRRESEHLKSLVLENLRLYTEHLKKLISKLNSIDTKKPRDYLNVSFSLLNEFSKLSRVPFRKATILIGKEMGAIKETIKVFGDDLIRLTEANKALFEKDLMINSINNLLGEFEQNKSTGNSFDENIKQFNSLVTKNEEKINEIKEEIIRIKNSADYTKEIEEIEALKKREAELDKNLQELKNKVDFKQLAKVFHSNEKNHEFIKKYSMDFKQALKNDENLQIITLINDAKVPEVPELKDMRDKLFSLDSSVETPVKKKLLNLQDELIGFENKKIGLTETVDKEVKKKERLSEKIKKLSVDIKAIADKLFDEIKVV